MGDGGHETDDDQEDDENNVPEIAPAPPSPSPPPPAVPPPQPAGDMMTNLLKQVLPKITCFEGNNAVHAPEPHTRMIRCSCKNQR